MYRTIDLMFYAGFDSASGARGGGGNWRRFGPTHQPFQGMTTLFTPNRNNIPYPIPRPARTFGGIEDAVTTTLPDSRSFCMVYYYSRLS